MFYVFLLRDTSWRCGLCPLQRVVFGAITCVWHSMSATKWNFHTFSCSFTVFSLKLGHNWDSLLLFLRLWQLFILFLYNWDSLLLFLRIWELFILFLYVTMDLRDVAVNYPIWWFSWYNCFSWRIASGTPLITKPNLFPYLLNHRETVKRWNGETDKSFVLFHLWKIFLIFNAQNMSESWKRNKLFIAFGWIHFSFLNEE